MAKIKVNLEGVDPEGGFVLFPAGKHLAEVTNCEEGTSESSGGPMLTWTWRGVEGAAKDITAKSWTSLMDHALGNLRQHGEALGIMDGEDIEVDTDRVIGLRAYIYVDHEEIKSRKTGKMMTVSNIKRVEAAPRSTPAGRGGATRATASSGSSRARRGNDELPF